MKIETKYFGEQEIDEKDVYHFERGLPGFLDEKVFILQSFSEGSPFYILQSLVTSTVAFVVVSPFLFKTDYEIDIPDATIEQLDIQSEKEVSIFVIVSLKKTLESSTANLMAPIIINENKRTGKQLIVHEEKEALHFPLFKKQTVRKEG